VIWAEKDYGQKWEIRRMILKPEGETASTLDSLTLSMRQGPFPKLLDETPSPLSDSAPRFLKGERYSRRV